MTDQSVDYRIRNDPNVMSLRGKVPGTWRPEDDRPCIEMLRGELHAAADAGIAALAADDNIFQRGGKIVYVTAEQTRGLGGKTILTPTIKEVTAPLLRRKLGLVAHWVKWNTKAEDKVPIDPPYDVVEQILKMEGDWPFPVLAGVIGCPTMRFDGSLLVAKGYDPGTGLVLLAAVDIPPFSENPTREEAAAAAQMLEGLLGEFPFVDDASKSVAMSALMTPVLRGAMTLAPMHLVLAPESGTGKSYLIDIGSTIATGDGAAAVAVAAKPEETEKRLIGSALAGYTMIALDNVSGSLESDLLCQLTERPLLQLRALGRSDQYRVTNVFTVFANGNNVDVAADMVRRTIRCEMDADIEHPADREFKSEPLDAVRAHRGRYVAAVITIARAYVAAGKPGRLKPLPSYKEWSDLVRSALVWLGYADPVASMEATRAADPVHLQRAVVFGAWRDELDKGRLLPGQYQVADIINFARETDGNCDPIRPQLKADC